MTLLLAIVAVLTIVAAYNYRAESRRQATLVQTGLDDIERLNATITAMTIASVYYLGSEKFTDAFIMALIADGRLDEDVAADILRRLKAQHDAADMAELTESVAVSFQRYEGKTKHRPRRQRVVS
jgi:hypothetical protein